MRRNYRKRALKSQSIIIHGTLCKYEGFGSHTIIKNKVVYHGNVILQNFEVNEKIVGFRSFDENFSLFR